MTRFHNFLGDAVMLAIAGLLALTGRGGSTLPDDGKEDE